MTIEIKITADTPAEVLAELVAMVELVSIAEIAGKAGQSSNSVDTPNKSVPKVPGKKKPTQRTTKKATKPEETATQDTENKEENTSVEKKPTNKTAKTSGPQDNAEAKKQALAKLMSLYNSGGETRDNVKALLGEYGVAKFSEIPEDKGPELLKKAEELETA